MPASEFIDVLEETGLITELGGNRRQRDMLAEERCRIMQGQSFATALAPEQFPSACVQLERSIGIG